MPGERHQLYSRRRHGCVLFNLSTSFSRNVMSCSRSATRVSNRFFSFWANTMYDARIFEPWNTLSTRPHPTEVLAHVLFCALSSPPPSSFCTLPLLPCRCLGTRLAPRQIHHSTPVHKAHRSPSNSVSSHRRSPRSCSKTCHLGMRSFLQNIPSKLAQTRRPHTNAPGSSLPSGQSQ